MSTQQRTALMKRWRGVVLELVYQGHCTQQSRLDDLALWGLMRDLSHDVSRNDVITVLQQLETRGYLKFKQNKDATTGHTDVREIQITAQGTDLVEKISSPDAAVTLL